MEISTKEHIYNIASKSAALKLVRKVLNTSYPLALWRLPNSYQHYILIDIRRSAVSQELEDLNHCFVINPYNQSHPPKPTILCGDVIIKVAGDKAETVITPSLSANEMDRFFEALNQNPAQETKPAAKETGSNFEELVKEGLNQISAGAIEKVVLSRYQDYDLPESFDPIETYKKLTDTYTNAFCHLTNTKEYGLWIGATPEKMIAIEDDQFFSTDALAGTQPLPEGSDNLRQVAWTQKEIEEQAMVSRYIINCFKQIRLREYEEIGPRTVKAGNLAHLKTEYLVDMKATNSPMLGSIMLDLLHPTSAVCGHPRTVANDFILAKEGYDRELYAGFLGPVGFNRSTQLFVNLRCMKVTDNTARLFAGAGITEDSVPSKEYSETQYKMQTLLRVLGL